jgi:hypothetical protein
MDLTVSTWVSSVHSLQILPLLLMTTRDWEFPSAPSRGGRPEDAQNYVSLLKEMREAFAGTHWQLSVTIPSGYWYLRGFDLEGMRGHVDWFNVLSYDYVSWQIVKVVISLSWLIFITARIMDERVRVDRSVHSRTLQHHRD